VVRVKPPTSKDANCGYVGESSLKDGVFVCPEMRMRGGQRLQRLNILDVGLDSPEYRGENSFRVG